MKVVRGLAHLALLGTLACTTRGSSEHADTAQAIMRATPTAQSQAWPTDRLAGQLPSRDTEIPACAGRPLVTPDSLGPIRPGATLRELLVRCPDLLRYWDWGDEGMPEPAVAVRVGAATVFAVLEDTLPSSPVYRIYSADSMSQTTKGLGPGVTLRSLEEAYGSPQFQSAECRIYVYFPGQAGISWTLEIPKAANWECDAVEALNTDRTRRPPAESRVGQVNVYARDADA